jgi:hypothetical protein
MFIRIAISLFITLLSIMCLLISYGKIKMGNRIINEIIENKLKTKNYSAYSSQEIEAQIRMIWKVSGYFLLIFGILSFIILLFNGGNGLYIY